MMRSLQARLVAVLFSFVFVSLLLVGAVFYYNSTKLVSGMLGHQAQNIAEHARSTIDPAMFSRILDQGADSEEYEQLRQALDELRVSYGLKYLYTMSRLEQSGAYQYVVDGMPPGSEGASSFAEIEEEPDDALIRLYETGQPQAGELHYTEAYGATLSAHIPIVDAGGQLIGSVGADFDGQSIYEMQQRNMLILLGIGAGLLVVALGVAGIAARLLTRPLKRLTAQVDAAGKGDLTVSIGSGRKDEIGRLAQSFASLIGSLRLFIDVTRQHGAQLESSISLLTESSQASKESSLRIARSMQEAAAGADTHLQRSLESSRSLEEVAAGTNEIALAAVEAANASGKTRQEAEKGHASVQDIVRQIVLISEANEELRQRMAAMNSRSEQIDQIVADIAAIAVQTNILALNAGIEASRAGEHGRGFAVVAAEIRRLAEQTRVSSEQIAGMIGAVQEETKLAASAMDSAVEQVRTGQQLALEAGNAFGGILGEIRKLDSRFEEVAASSQSMAAGTEEVAASVSEAEEIVRRSVSHFTEAAAASSEQQERIAALNKEAELLQGMARELGELIARFRT